jgi:thymidylate synthase
MAATCGLLPGKLIMSFGDMHIYDGHIATMRRVVQNNIYPFPKLHVLHKRKNVWEYEFADLKLCDYKSNGYYPMPIVVSM